MSGPDVLECAADDRTPISSILKGIARAGGSPESAPVVLVVPTLAHIGLSDLQSIQLVADVAVITGGLLLRRSRAQVMQPDWCKPVAAVRQWARS
ncbi:hypothetical protein BJ987_003585 [Nocardia goodfellowii]|uniref:Uncharacterized protein n=1 Tax=Nocardia goodfellowii TaxID=882446 RepID=A0ABS4QG52_9NOCA|nr:hypothetical protein [Nocardia goodfellowii]